MLPGENRLRRSEDFAWAIRRGRRAWRRHLVVHLSRGRPAVRGPADTNPRGAGQPPVRVGFVVSKAVGNAVVRHRVQRRLRHLMRDRLSLLPTGSLVVVRALPGAGDVPFGQLAQELDAALRRLVGGARS